MSEAWDRFCEKEEPQMAVEANIVNKKIVLKFPHQLIEEPIICQLVKNYGLDVNILKAKITPREEGLLVLGLKGEESAYEAGVAYMEGIGVHLQLLSQDIVRNEERCTHCGACVTVCPSAALYLDVATQRVLFKEERCIACELCVSACPPRAMEVHY